MVLLAVRCAMALGQRVRLLGLASRLLVSPCVRRNMPVLGTALLNIRSNGESYHKRLAAPAGGQAHF